MKNLYYYIFYRLNKIFRILSFGLSDVTEWSALSILSLLEAFNVYVIIMLFELNDYGDIHFNNKKIAMGIILLFAFINFFVFIKDRRYDSIIRTFTEKKNIAIAYPLIFYTYVFLSIWLMFNVGGQVRETNLKKKDQEKGYQLPRMPN
jgi:hypothetical protein